MKMYGSTNGSPTTGNIETFAFSSTHGSITVYNQYCWANNNIVHIDVDIANTSANSITAQDVLVTIPDAYQPKSINSTYPFFEVQILNGTNVYGGIGWGGKKGIFLDGALSPGARFRLSYTYPRA